MGDLDLQQLVQPFAEVVDKHCHSGRGFELNPVSHRQASRVQSILAEALPVVHHDHICLYLGVKLPAYT